MKDEMDCITIELEVIAAYTDKDVWMHGDVVIRINGERPYSDDDVVNLDMLHRSLASEGEFFIFSCCCGIPECSGWDKGIAVSHHEGLVTWKNPMNGKTWTFEKTSMEKQIETMQKEAEFLIEFFTQKEIKYVGVGIGRKD